ncbi:MAG: hypothetical protein KC553_10205 [Nitrospina sp.]|nr:hypothetical protein [Nitrospina sp.]
MNRRAIFLTAVLSLLLPLGPAWLPGSAAQAQTKLNADPPELKNRKPPVFDGEKKDGEETAEPGVKPELPAAPSEINPETLRMMEIIERKNRELKQREEEMALREKNLQALEKKIQEDLDKIETALKRSEEQVGIKRDLIEKNVNNLVKVYSAMKAAEAAKLLENLDEGVAVQIVSKMKSKTAGSVLGKMKTDVAKRISEKIAGKRLEPNTRAN